MKVLTLLLLFSAALISCSPNVQVITLRGSNVRPADEGLVLDNDTLTLRYNFASERGLMHITLVNKLNQPLYVDWKRSSFIVGQDKFDYWYDVASIQLYGSTYTNRYSHYAIGSINGTISKDDQVGFIPPQTKLDKQQFVLVPNGPLQLAGPFKIEQEQSNTVDRRKPVDVMVYAYSVDQSPLTFRNYLTLSTDKDFRTEFHIDTKFWASDVKVLPQEQLLYKFDGVTLTPVSFKKSDSFYVPIPAQQ